MASSTFGPYSDANAPPWLHKKVATMDSEPTNAVDAFPYNSPARYRYLTPRERRILQRHNRRRIDTLINVGPGGITLDQAIHPV